MRKNITIDTDAYKITHWLQRPDNITKLYSYGEPRAGGKYKEVCFAGLQANLLEHLQQKVTPHLIEEGIEECISTFGTDKYYPKAIWEKVMKLGYFPLRIKTIPEGTIVGENNVCFTIESTQEWFANMISHFEDILMWSWYCTDVSTRSMNIKRGILPSFQKSSDVTEYVLPVAVNDFGLRGAMGYEAAIMGGIGHLIHFTGSDNMPASRMIKDFYGMQGRAKSVWATEHSVATAFGPGVGEYEYLMTQLTRADLNKIVSIVIDSYDPDNFMQNIVSRPEVVALIKERATAGGRTGFRPDTGKPLVNVCKYSDILGATFGFNINTKGYKTLKENTFLLQGDGMTEESIPLLYSEYIKTGWAADNALTGSGGGLLTEGLTRDRQRWAIKLSYAERDRQAINVRKNPKNDPTKASKAGLLKLHRTGGSHITLQSSEMERIQFDSYVDTLKDIYVDGKFTLDTFDNIIKRANK